MLPDTDHKPAPDLTPIRPPNYYVAPLIAEENTGIQHCAYFDEQWSRVWPPTPLDSDKATSLRIEQADARDISKLPPDIQEAIGPNARLAGAVVRTFDSSSLTSFIPLESDGSITVTIQPKQRRGAILLFSARDGSFGLRPTTDPQITNSGYGTS